MTVKLTLKLFQEPLRQNHWLWKHVMRLNVQSRQCFTNTISKAVINTLTCVCWLSSAHRSNSYSKSKQMCVCVCVCVCVCGGLCSWDVDICPANVCCLMCMSLSSVPVRVCGPAYFPFSAVIRDTCLCCCYVYSSITERYASPVWLGPPCVYQLETCNSWLNLDTDARVDSSLRKRKVWIFV